MEEHVSDGSTGTRSAINDATRSGMFPTPSTTAEPVSKNHTCDVLVVGGLGFAGLVATLHAAEQGVKVIAIDKQTSESDYIGGDLIISGHSIHIASHSLELPEDELLAIIQSVTGNQCPQEIAKAHAHNAKRAMTWLINTTGQEFVEPPGSRMAISPPLPQPNCWGMLKTNGPNHFRLYGGCHLAHTLLNLITTRTNAMILYGTKALDLLTNEAGAVSGVLAQGEKGRFSISAKATILATGGFQKNKEMMLKYVGPHADEMNVYNLTSGAGDGHRMALRVGAQMRSMNYIGFHVMPEAAPRLPDLNSISYSFPAAIVVNSNGRRFCDESAGVRLMGSTMAKSMINVTGFYVMDSTIYRTAAPSIDIIRRFGGAIYEAQTIADLATAAGIGSYLATELSSYNAAINSGTTAGMGVPRVANAVPIIAPPFCAIPFRLSTLSTFGGALIDSTGNLLDVDCKPIPALYGAGCIVQGSLSGGVENSRGAYVGSLGACLIWGLISSESAAAYARKLAL